jgi:hypothetical protein
MQAISTSAAVRALARAHAASRVDDLLGSDELSALVRQLGSVPSLNYDAYCMVRDTLPPKAASLLTASLFARVRAPRAAPLLAARAPGPPSLNPPTLPAAAAAPRRGRRGVAHGAAALPP